MTINIVKLGTGVFAGTLTAGLLALPVAAAAVGGDDSLKRDEDAADVVLVHDERDDDDDTDTGTNGNTNTGTNTGGTNTGTGTNSGDQNDGTNSRHTGVSRDSDISRGDKTRDWTKDGKGDGKRDWSQNQTNDNSRNDTR